MTRMLARSLPVVVAVVVIQSTVFADLRVAGVAPELVAIVVVLAGLFGGAETGAITGFSAGLLYDVLLPTPFGLAAISYTATGYVIGSLQSGLHEPVWWLAPSVAAFGSATATAVYAVLGELLGQDLVNDDLGRIIVVVGITALPLGAAAAPLVRWMVDPAVSGRPARADV